MCDDDDDDDDGKKERNERKTWLSVFASIMWESMRAMLTLCRQLTFKTFNIIIIMIPQSPVNISGIKTIIFS